MKLNKNIQRLEKKSKYVPESVKNIRNLVKEKLKHRAHDVSHIQRVEKLVLTIGEKEGADCGVLKIAAILHDICRPEEFEGTVECHATAGAKILKN